jgi:ferredoxin
MSDLNFGDCIGCGLCILGCPAYEETGFDVLTARGRNKALQSGLAASDMVEPIWACTLCGYCDAICPSSVHNVKIVLHLRRELAGTTTVAARTTQASAPRGLVLGCTIRERAPHLIPSIHEFLRRIGRPSSAPEEGCCGSLDVEAGRAMPSRAVAGGVADPICLEQYDAEFLGLLAMQHLDLFELTPPGY